MVRIWLATVVFFQYIGGMRVLCCLVLLLSGWSVAWSGSPVMPGPVPTLQSALNLENYYVEKEGQTLQRAFPEGTNLWEKLQEAEAKGPFMDSLTPVERFRLTEQIDKGSGDHALFGISTMGQRMGKAIDHAAENPNPIFIKMLTLWVKSIMNIQRSEGAGDGEAMIKETVRETVRETVKETVKETDG